MSIAHTNLKFFFKCILETLIELYPILSIIQYNDLIDACFGFEDDEIYDIQINIFRIRSNAIFCNLFNFAKSAILEIIQQYSIVDETIINPILDSFIIVFQKLYDSECTVCNFIESLKKIPFYINDKLIRWHTNNFIIQASYIFCSNYRTQKISEILSLLN